MKDFVTANLKGGLGNIIFQMASAIVLANENSVIAVFDGQTQGNQHWSDLEKYKKTIFKEVIFAEVVKANSEYHEPFFHFNKIPYSKNLKLNGYFQSEKYFINKSDLIYNTFFNNKDIINNLKDKYNYIDFETATSLHVRRGDYLKLKNQHPTCSLRYYMQALKKTGVDNVVVFSDDIKWCKQNMPNKFTFIENEKDYNEMYMMSLCKNNIIANSSFSWWGAWANRSENKIVIAPKRWFGPLIKHNTKDLIPKRWNII
jgi:hypothetical protein